MAWARLYAWTSTLLPQHRCRPAAHRTPGWPPFKDGLFSFQHDRSPVHTAASVTRLLEDSCETGVDSVKPEHAFRGCVEKKCLPNEGILPSHFLHGSILHVLHVSISYMSAHSMRALVCAATALMPPHVCHFARQPLHPVLCPCFVSLGVFRHGVVCKLHSCLQVKSCRVPMCSGTANALLVVISALMRFASSTGEVSTTSLKQQTRHARLSAKGRLPSFRKLRRWSSNT